MVPTATIIADIQLGHPAIDADPNRHRRAREAVEQVSAARRRGKMIASMGHGLTPGASNGPGRPEMDDGHPRPRAETLASRRHRLQAKGGGASRGRRPASPTGITGLARQRLSQAGHRERSVLRAGRPGAGRGRREERRRLRRGSRMLTRAGQFRQPVGPRPGDLVQFRDYAFTRTVVTDDASRTSTAETGADRPHHTPSSSGSGRMEPLTLLEQTRRTAHRSREIRSTSPPAPPPTASDDHGPGVGYVVVLPRPGPVRELGANQARVCARRGATSCSFSGSAKCPARRPRLLLPRRRRRRSARRSAGARRRTAATSTRPGRFFVTGRAPNSGIVDVVIGKRSARRTCFTPGCSLITTCTMR